MNSQTRLLAVIPPRANVVLTKEHAVFFHPEGVRSILVPEVAAAHPTTVAEWLSLGEAPKCGCSYA